MAAFRSNDFLDLVYDAALEPALWTSIVERLADLTGGGGGWLSQLNIADGSGADESDPLVGVDASFAPHYIQYYSLRNPLSNVDRPDEYLRNWRPIILTDEDWIAKEDLLKTEFYNDFLKRHDIHSSLFIRLAIQGKETATLNIARPERRGRFEQRDLQAAERYHPHLIRAFDLGRKFAATRRLSGDMANVLDHSPHGVFLLDEMGRVRHVNCKGEALLAESGGLTVIHGRLSACNVDAARQIHAHICKAASGDEEQRVGGSMALPTPARRVPLSLTIAPVRPDRFSPFHSGRSVLVCVSDLEAGITLPEQRLRDLFGLTPAETRVALALFDGMNQADVATSLGISFYTVRNHLVRVFEKTGVNRQIDLVRLMMRAISVA